MTTESTTGIAAPPVGRKHSVLGYLSLTGSIVGVGSALIFVRLSEVDPTATLMLRAVAATLILGFVVSPVPARRRIRLNEVVPRDLFLLALSSAIFGADLLANQWAVHFTSVANTALLINLTPFFVLIFSWLFLRERITMTKTLTVILALAGSVLIVLGGQGRTELSWTGDTHLLGDFLALVSAALYGVYMIMTKDLRARMPTLLVMIANSLVIAVLLAPLAMATSSPILPATVGGYLLIVAYALVSQLLGHGLMAYALRAVDTTFASMFTLLTPVVSVLLGWLILGEGMGMTQMVGGAIIMVALAWFQQVTARSDS
jgi:drug/metabolite transporter (DMT)-like permease